MAGGPRSSPINQQEMADRAANTSSRRTMEDNENMRSRLADQNISIRLFPWLVLFDVVIINNKPSQLSRSAQASITTQDISPRGDPRYGR